MDIKIGQLLQYKLDHWGKYFDKLPMFPRSHRFMMLPQAQKNKIYQIKYCLLACSIQPVQYLSFLPCDYVLCLVAHENFRKKFWVEADWLEPFNQQSYETELFCEIKNIFNEMKKTKF